MKTTFYSQIIEINSVYTQLDLLDITTQEREELIMIIESSIHHLVIDILLTHLPSEDKKTFLQHVTNENHQEIWNLLKEKMKDPEKKIRKAVDGFKKQLHNDIAKIKKKKT